MSATTKHHAESTDAEIESAIEYLSTYLAGCNGRENAVSSKELAEKVGLKPTTVRDLIPEIRKRYRMPIASCSQGYFKIQNKQEFQEVMYRIEETIRTKRQRQRELSQAFYTENRDVW